MLTLRRAVNPRSSVRTILQPAMSNASVDALDQFKFNGTRGRRSATVVKQEPSVTMTSSARVTVKQEEVEDGKQDAPAKLPSPMTYRRVTRSQKRRLHISIGYEESQSVKKEVKQEVKKEGVKKPRRKNRQTKRSRGSSKGSPENWEVVYENIREMRKHRTAPVDSMGCERLADDAGSAEIFRYQTLISLMLSSQTKVCVCVFAVCSNNIV